MRTRQAPGPTSPDPPARRRPLLRVPGALLALAWAVPVAALTPFQFGKQEEVARPTWSVTAQGGVSLSGGNAPSSGATAEASVGRRSRRQRLQLGGSLSLARTRVETAREQDGTPGIGPGELLHETQTTRQAWALQSRYDLFATPHSSAYGALSATGDRPAGKQLVLSGQVGYGVDVLHPEHQVLRLELGYDLSREQPVLGPTLQIHSARLFVGYQADLDERLAVTAEVEALTNLNAEASGAERVERLRDTRVLGRLTGTHKLNGSLSVCLKLGAAYDAAPPLRPPPAGTSFEEGFAPHARRLDTSADLLLRLAF